MHVNLPPHRLMSLREADEAFGLEAIWESAACEDGKLPCEQQLCDRVW